ncbi:60S acidic ribosomal protein P1-like isoform X2 [Mus caroli]|uniref:60S acidic ribosomal protein P1-like isoform X2 n=1 Tax=Mus caroli TaxID=10089 RepID=A0A6P5P646_MUSCR|nr:60S acidic ribosomal protein P1-like isoform X2 [Mus caroli]
MPAIHNMVSLSKLTCIYSALILQDNEVMVTEALANVNTGSLICNDWAAGPAPLAGAAPSGGPAPSIAAALAEEKKLEEKKEESEESEDDRGFGLFD